MWNKFKVDIIDVALVFLLLILNMFLTASVSIVDFEQVNVSWDLSLFNI